MDEAALTAMLLECGQSHIFERWKTRYSEGGGESADIRAKKAEFFDQIRVLHANYPGGLTAYIRRARSLLHDAKAGVNPMGSLAPSVPAGVTVDIGSDEHLRLESIGVRHFGECAVVLVAGGVGERLGYRGIKVRLPCETTTSTSYLELYISNILALQRLSAQVNSAPEVDVPLVIMTSDDTHAATLEMLRRNGDFGMRPGQITALKQEKVAAIEDIDGRIAMLDDFTVDTKPHGHGDIHVLLHMHGIAARWRDDGKRYVVFLQDTNGMSFVTIPSALGASVECAAEINSVCLPRKAGEAVGVIAVLTAADGASFTGNIEYNQLDPMLRSIGEADVNDATGWSPYPGNTNTLIYALQPYVDVLGRTGGLVPEFVNPKYADATKQRFQRPTRLECMMQEHSRMVGAGARVIFTKFPAWIYMPCKNSVAEAVGKQALGLPLQCASAAEMAQYGAAGRWLRAIGVDVADAVAMTLPRGLVVECPPRVVIHPSTACTLQQLRSRFVSPSLVHISARSSLVLRGDVTIHALHLDGALCVEAAAGATVVIHSLRVSNAGWQLETVSDDDECAEELRIRGFRTRRDEQLLLHFPVAGHYVVGGPLVQ